MITIQEALRELNKRPLRESSKRDDIDANRDDKVEKAEAGFNRVVDDADADRDYKLKTEGFNDIVENDIETDGFNSIVKEEDLKEDLSTFNTLPVELLSETEVKDYIENIPEARPNRPPVFFKLGYIKDMDKDIAAKYRGGRGAGDNPKVKIVKCTEYSKLYTGVPYTATNATKKADKVLGTERHTGERSGFNFGREGNVENRIGSYPNGKLALQAYIADSSNQKVKYFISIDDGELQEISRDEVAEYLTPAVANRVKNGSQRKAAGIDAQGNELYDKAINRFPLNGIYMIGNLGHSVF